jgi:hypothetical protein
MAKTVEKERYVVAPGCSFVGNKRAYNAGDEIGEEAFGNPKDFQKFISGKSPKIIKAPPEEKKSASKNTGGGNAKEPDTEETDTDTPVDRKQLEESVIARGLGKPEDLTALSDDELKRLLGNAE